MTKLLRCPACKGQKQVMKLGMTMHECEMCYGMGHVKDHEIPKIYHPAQTLPVEDFEPQEVPDKLEMVKDNFPDVYDDDFKPNRGTPNGKKKKR